ncbi:MAG: pyridoxamine 5'-phosphate oxidase family protein, partial [Acidimicrobiales bacterium]
MMDLEEALAHFRQNHRAVLATRRRDGRPQLSPVVHAVGNDGRIMVSTRTGAM